MRKAFVGVTLLGLAVLLALGWRLQARRSGPVGIVLISIDTLRADHLGAYGYPLETSPFFDEFAARGSLFERAVVQLPGTLPSHMSMFTGLYPPEHGVYPPDSVLAPEIATLPELFAAAGYRTAGYSEGGYVAGSYGFARGFEVYDDVVKKKPGGAADTFARALSFVEGLGDDETFFLFVHTYEVHDPYTAPEGYLSWPGEPPAIWEPTGANLTAASRGELELSVEGLEYFVSLYDGSIRYVDDQLRALMERLWETVSHDSWIVITSDHGEEFLEHGSLVHRQIYEPTLHVPLLIRQLGQRRGRRISSLVESVDLAPTLLELAEIEPPAGSMSGSSLVGLLDGGSTSSPRTGYAEGVARPSRAIYRQTSDSLLQLVQSWGDTAGEVAVGESHTFRSTAGRARVRIRAHQRPRRATLAVNGERRVELTIDPERAATVDLELEEARLNRIELEVEGCDPVVEGMAVGDDRPRPECVAAFIEGPVIESVELFDLIADPSGETDRSGRLRATARELLDALEAWSPVGRAEGRREALTEEQVERLRALGYLQ